jgi:dTMP kinase
MINLIKALIPIPTKQMKSPKFIVIEGIDGCGKTTQVNLLGKWLSISSLLGEDQSLVISREPGGTELGKNMRNLILNNSGEAPVEKAELLMYMADRAQHVDKVISPALKRGDWVLLDRYTGSTMAYQGYGKGLSNDYIGTLADYTTDSIYPDLTIWLDTPLHICMERIKSKDPDRMESNGYEFMSRVQYGFSELCHNNDSWVRIDGNQIIDIIQAEIQHEILNMKFSTDSLPDLSTANSNQFL